VELARNLGLDPDALASARGVEILAGNRVAEGSEPLAQAYAGHQFGYLCLNSATAAPFCWEK
jgi:serine/tyrosine/threonine adenylyltransferase